MTHWAADLIGRPWAPDAYGPEQFFCWGLVHYVFKTRLGIELPLVTVGQSDEDNYSAIKQVQTDSGWRPTKGEPEQEFDIVVMRGPHGPHVGVMVGTSSGLLLLHADGYLGVGRKPHGGVVAQRLRDVRFAGYGHIKIWRKGP
jgi:cell wall-associated NlpC family hydrolase